MKSLEKSLHFVFGSEGGYSNHLSDKGGATNMGITHGTLSKAYSLRIVNHKDVTKLTREEASNIYQALYWNPSKSNKMPEPLCTLHFDAAVNHGVGGAGKLLQRTINNYAKKAGIALTLKVDGAVGARTLAGLFLCIEYKNNLKLICEIYVNEREKLFHTIVKNNPTQKVFLRGWLNRVEKNRRYINAYYA
ncbi:MAG: glycosyl hydrolase 108 family protein [Synergistaceae bacterium]